LIVFKKFVPDLRQHIFTRLVTITLHFLYDITPLSGPAVLITEVTDQFKPNISLNPAL